MNGIMNKRNIILVSLIIILLLVLVKLYGTFAFGNISDVSFEGANKVFNLIVDDVNDNIYTTTVSKNDTKDLRVVLVNKEGIDLNYLLYYSGILKNSEVEVGVLGSCSYDGFGVIDKNSTYVVDIRVINSTSSDINISFGVSYGYVNGGDLIVGEDEYKIDNVIENDVNLDQSGANSPSVNNNMIPVYYDEYSRTWKKADETNVDGTTMWYDYDDKKWANVVLKNNDTIVDLSNNLNNGVNKGANWDKNNGYVITSNNGYVDCGLANYYFGDKMSVVLKFKINSNVSDNQLLIGNVSDNSGFSLSYTNIGDVYTLNGVLGLSDSDESLIVSSSETLELNTWYTVVLTYNATDEDNANFNLYLNGKLVGSVKGSGTIKVSSKEVRVGGNSDITVSDVLIFNNYLGEDVILSNYKDSIIVGNDSDLFVYYNFMDGLDIPNGTVIGDNLSNGTLAFFTWIPRYKYKVWNIEKVSSQYSYTSDDGTLYDAYNDGIDVVWESGTSSTGTIDCNYIINNNVNGYFVDDYTNNLSLSEACIGSNGEYYTHPAFSFGEEKAGFWIGKFETTGSLDESTVLPDVVSVSSDSMSDVFDSALNFSKSSLYGIEKFNSHLVKNIEWGAVSYLTHSIYGLCDGYSCSDINLNNSIDNYTGRSLGRTLNDSEPTTNNTGNYTYEGYVIDEEFADITSTVRQSYVASTTGNIYGVYDMAGGRGEYISGVMVGQSGTLSASMLYLSNVDKKYYNLYSYGNEYNTQLSYNRSILGDAIGEIVLTDSIDNGLWYNHYSYNFNSISEILVRGGNSGNISNSGLFSFEAISVYSPNEYGYRIVLG